jgi:hypothetical protein
MLKLGTIFPLLAISLAFYIVLTAASGGDAWTGAIAMQLQMPSGKLLTMTGGDVFVLLSLGLLFVEIIKAVYTGAQGIINHGLSVLVLITSCIMFSTNASYATVPFLLLTMMALVDVVAGIVISVVAARRDFGTGGAHHA